VLLRNVVAPTTPQQSVDGMIRVIDILTLEHHGRFFTMNSCRC
jgi:hypothetical protein